MCILCVASRLSRRIVTMLLWLVIPLITLWAFSQLLPPSLRFEITSPRLACVLVLLISIGWYEIIKPWFSAWRARRSALMKERKIMEAQMTAKWHKEAVRKCRNCLTAYKDQNPVSGRFMCGYCGHISRRPVLDMTKVYPDIAGSENMENFRKNTVVTFQGISQGGKCPARESYSGAAVSVGKTLEFLVFFVRWLWKKIWRRNSLSEKKALNPRGKVDIQKSEDRCNYRVNKVEKAKRKAEEKRQAKLAKKMLEEEERKQREEVARLVEERRKLKNEKLEVKKESEWDEAAEREQEIQREKEGGRKQRAKERAKAKVFGKDNDLANGEEVKNTKINVIEQRSKLEKNGETENRIPKIRAQHFREPMKNEKSSRSFPLTWERGSKINGQAMRGGKNGTAQVGSSRYYGPLKYSIVSRGNSASYSSAAAWACDQRFGVKSSKTVNSLVASSNSNGSSGSVGLNYGQSTNSVWNKTAWSNIWNKGSLIMHDDNCNKETLLCDSKIWGDSQVAKNANCCTDRVYPSQSPVGVELQTASQVTLPTKSWQNLCTTPSTSSWISHSLGLGNELNEEMSVEIGSNSFPMQVTPSSLHSSGISFGSSDPTHCALEAATSTYGNFISVSGSPAGLLHASGFISPISCASPVRPLTIRNNFCEDSLFEADAASLLGPVSELANFSSDIGSTLPLGTSTTTGVLSSGCTPVSAPSQRPVHIPSPISRASSREIEGSVHVNGEQLSPITDLWSLPSLSLDGANDIPEKGNWNIWEMPKVGQCKFGESSWLLPPQCMSVQEGNLTQPLPSKIPGSVAEPENPISDCILPSWQNDSSSEKNGCVDIWSSQPVLESSIEGLNNVDCQPVFPNFVNGIKEGSKQQFLNAAKGNAC